MKKLIFLSLLVVLINFLTTENSFSQTWSAGRYYAYQGNVTVICGNPYPKYSPPDAFGNSHYLGIYKLCRKTVWHQEWREGWIYYWNYQYRYWYREWHRGYYWYFQWEYFDVRVN